MNHLFLLACINLIIDDNIAGGCVSDTLMEEGTANESPLKEEPINTILRYSMAVIVVLTYTGVALHESYFFLEPLSKCITPEVGQMPYSLKEIMQMGSSRLDWWETPFRNWTGMCWKLVIWILSGSPGW
jgi:hypothetical protein